jgi:DNA-binding HxlR family transcriptional regulator
MSSSRKKLASPTRLPCPLASSLDIFGDKWSLLVIRDIFFGKKTFSEFQKSAERIPSNILAERLKRLETAEIIQKKVYQQRPVRYSYHLTEKGKDLGLVMKSMVDWGNKYIPGTLPFSEIIKIMNKSRKKLRSQGQTEHE